MGDLESKPNPQLPRSLIILGTTIVVGFGGFQVYKIRQNKQEKTSSTQAATITTPPVRTVTALGRLEPRGKVIKLSAPTPTQGNRVERLLVKEGDMVKVGQVVAILDSRSRLQAAYQEAEATVKIAQINLEKVQQGAKIGEIKAQKAEIGRIEAQRIGDESGQQLTILRLEAQWQGETTSQRAIINRLQVQLKNAQLELERYQQIYRDGAISQSLFDSKTLTVETIAQQLKEATANLERMDKTGRRQIEEAKTALNRIRSTGGEQIISAKATLNKIAEVRPIDVAAAMAELNRAKAVAKQAKASLDQVYIKSPQKGIIFDIHTRAGELVGNEGIVEIGETSQMYAVAEVYQSDISKIIPQQRVKILSSSLEGELQGTVDRIGWEVKRQNVINSDPSDNIDARVVEVYIKLDPQSSQKAEKFTNLQIKAVISL
jgi:HlyD family secretion protein